jgi:hypothetical protein
MMLRESATFGESGVHEMPRKRDDLERRQNLSE